MMRRLVGGLAIAALLSAANASAAPFGLKAGAPLSSYGATPIPQGGYRLTEVPLRQPDLVDYYGLGTQQSGLCKVIAVTSPDSADRFGEQTRAKYDRLSSALRQKYGEPTTDIDTLRTGAIWTEPDEFAMSLLHKDRVLSRIWMAPTAQADGGDISRVMIQADASPSAETVITITYELSNFDTCAPALSTERHGRL
jgi:hypothetical protein